MARTIIEMMPKCKIYCEPFFGGGAVFFQKPKEGIEVINDCNKMLINFYLVVQNDFDKLYELIQNSLHSEEMYYRAKDIYNKRCEATDLEKAWAVWMITNGSFGGSMHGGWKWCNGGSGSHTAIFLKNKRKSFQDDLKQRLEQVQISSRDALRVIKDRDKENTFFYLDPPYPGHVQGHYYGYTHKDLYNLLIELSRIKGKFILSNYWCQTIRYFVAINGWHVKEIEMSLKINQKGGQKVETRKEMLIYNYDIQ